MSWNSLPTINVSKVVRYLISYTDQNIWYDLCIIFSVGGTVLAGGAAAFGAGLLTNNQGLRDAGLTSVLAGGALKGVSTLLGKKWIVSVGIADQC